MALKNIVKTGKRLVCVRYKHDITGKEKLKTIGLIVECEPGEPSENKITANNIMNIRIDQQSGTAKQGKESGWKRGHTKQVLETGI